MARSVSAYVKQLRWSSCLACFASTHLATALDEPTVAHLGAQQSIEQALVVHYRGQCIDAPDLAVRIAGWLERDHVDADLAIRVQGGDEPRLHAEFELHLGGERVAVRRFQRVPGGCDDLRAALGFGIALAVDASASGAANGAELAPSPPPGEIDLSPAPPATSRSPRPVAWFEASALSGVIPEWAPSASAGGGLQFERLLVRIGAIATVPRTTPVAQGSARISLSALRFDSCWRFDSAPEQSSKEGRWGALVCSGLAGGLVAARGREFEQPASGVAPWSAALARLGLELNLGPDAILSLYTDGIAAFVRPRLAVEAPTGALNEEVQLGTFGGGLGLSFRTGW